MQSYTSEPKTSTPNAQNDQNLIPSKIHLEFQRAYMPCRFKTILKAPGILDAHVWERKTRVSAFLAAQRGQTAERGALRISSAVGALAAEARGGLGSWSETRKALGLGKS